jgi:hypothetical protein
MNEFIVFVTEIVAFCFLAFAEAEVEGKYGGGGKNAKFFKFGPITVRRYHFYFLYVSIPLFLFLSVIAAGFSWKLVGILASGALIGGIFEDFLWFVVNPNYGIKKFNSKDAYWLRWWKFGKFELPYFYITNPITALVIWLIFVL